MGFIHFFTDFFNFSAPSLWMNLFSCFIGLLIIGLPLVLLIAIGYWIVSVVGFAMAPYEYETGIVANKYYKSESFSTGVGTGINSEGKVTPVMTTNYDNEEFIIEYKSSDDKKKYRIETDQGIYDDLEVGDKVKAYYKISKTTKTFKWTGGFEKM